jgi:tRNA-dihydrouridine synthase A
MTTKQKHILKNGLPSLSVAPMMDCTDKHNRYFMRLIAPHFLLYTEMINALAIHHGDKEKLLGFDPKEHPVALQLGGSDPAKLASAAKWGQDYGYAEINLNVGCPSPRVSAGRFGACLMLEPALVADCIAAMRASVTCPVTVKCRIGVDDHDNYTHLQHFIETVSKTGTDTFIIHARKAWLKGLSPKQNREIPPLRYDIVHQLKNDFPQLDIIINGGLKTPEDIITQLQHVDGVMLGRVAYNTPYSLAAIEQALFPDEPILSPHEVIEAYLPYVEQQLTAGTRLPSITRHLFGLFHGLPGANAWRRHLSEQAHRKGAGLKVITSAAALVEKTG